MSGSPIYSFNGYLLFGSLNPVVNEPVSILFCDGLGVESFPSFGGSGVGCPASFSTPPVPSLP